MRSVQINLTSGIGSTGKICESIRRSLDRHGVENDIFCVKSRLKAADGTTEYMSALEVKKNALFSRLSGKYGFVTKRETHRLLKQLDRIRPDVIHLHNLHGHNCNLKLLFSYIRRHKIKVVWTFHDCWAFTGYCVHYDGIGCEKWKSTCEKCPQKSRYSWFFDRSRALFEEKKRLLHDLDLTVVTPSRWMAKQVSHSFLAEHPVKVIPNGIDLSVFRPRKSDFRARHHLEGKFILLGVSFVWNERKGLDVFRRLSERLDSEFQIVLVGTDEHTERRLSPGILSIRKTQDQEELSEIYSAADLFVNPTREENYPTVNMEALACGTPVLTFDTGGSAEIPDETCGSAVEKNDVEALYREILRIYKTRPFDSAACRKRAEAFDQDACFSEYVSLYSELKKEKTAQW